MASLITKIMQIESCFPVVERHVSIHFLSQHPLLGLSGFVSKDKRARFLDLPNNVDNEIVSDFINVVSNLYPKFGI